jgi:cytochrome c5
VARYNQRLSFKHPLTPDFPAVQRIESTMSDTQHDAHDDHHTGPIKTPGQLLKLVAFSFIVPIFCIIGLVYYVTTQAKPAGAGNAETWALGGITQAEHNKAVAARIQKVGTVEIRDANRPLKAGAEVYKAQCVACHAAGVAGAPKFGDAAAWGTRIATGYAALLNSALKGKGAMAAQGGGDFDDAEVGRAVVHMANAAGAKFAEPQRAAATEGAVAAK